jgi:peptide/nickel transport system permease protein
VSPPPPPRPHPLVEVREGVSRFQLYVLRKAGWYLGVLVVAVLLNWLLPRLIPGNPVDVLVAGLGGGAQGEQVKHLHEVYVHLFGLDKPMWQQFLIYMGNLLHGDMGQSFSNFPTPVWDMIAQSLPWTLALQIPAIAVGWLLGNGLGAVAAYRGGWFDRGAFLSTLFASSMPYYCLAILLLFGLAIAVPLFPASGGYSFANTPELSIDFILDAMGHYWLPFLSLVLVFTGTQAVGMRSMAIYELNADYVTYGRSLGIGDGRIIRYIFRNGALPQVTGLAISLATVVFGALITEIVFNYPGVGSLLFSAIRQSDYPVVSGVTLLVVVMLVVAQFLVDILVGVIDPRIRAAQVGER